MEILKFNKNINANNKNYNGGALKVA